MNEHKIGSRWTMTLNSASAPGIILLSLLSIFYWQNRTEDFMYYYCAGWVRAQDQSPYDPARFQDCIQKVLGRPNTNISSDAGSAYPPSATATFLPLASLSYRNALAVWTIFLFLASCLILRLLSFAPLVSSFSPLASGLLFLAWPGFLLNLAYHKLTLLLFAYFLMSVYCIEQGQEILGGWLVGMLAIQPQWYVCALLSVHRKSLAFLTALLVGIGLSAALSLSTQDLGSWQPWLVSLTHHSNQLVSLDNQSLFVALYKPLRNILPGPSPELQTIRYGLSLFLFVTAIRYCKRRSLQESLPMYLALYLLALPYSHGSDALWAFPLYFQLLSTISRRYSWNLNKVALVAAAVSLGIALACRGYLAPNLNKIPFQFLMGYCTAALVLLEMILSLSPFGGEGKMEKMEKILGEN